MLLVVNNVATRLVVFPVPKFCRSKLRVTVSPGSIALLVVPQFSAMSVADGKSINGGGDADGTIEKSALHRSKNTLPTASTFIRAFVQVMFGKTTTCAPSFGVLLLRVMGYVKPPFVERRMFTIVVFTGAFDVPATFQVTVCKPEN